jgi:hypothetical protein
VRAAHGGAHSMHKDQDQNMQYIRRRIQRVSGVTVRDERIESRDFSVQSWREDWDDLSTGRRERAVANRDMPTYKRQGVGYRERS